MNLRDIVWPIYKIREYNVLNTERGISYIETYTGSYIIDNKNLKGNSLAERRLRIDKDERYPLSEIIFNMSELAHDKSTTRKYIDSSGEIFSYKKEHFYKVTCHKVIKIKSVEGLGIVVWGKNLKAPVTVNNIPIEKIRYITVVNISGGYFLYDVRTQKCKDTKRKL